MRLAFTMFSRTRACESSARSRFTPRPTVSASAIAVVSSLVPRLLIALSSFSIASARRCDASSSPLSVGGEASRGELSRDLSSSLSGRPGTGTTAPFAGFAPCLRFFVRLRSSSSMMLEASSTSSASRWARSASVRASLSSSSLRLWTALFRALRARVREPIRVAASAASSSSTLLSLADSPSAMASLMAASSSPAQASLMRDRATNRCASSAAEKLPFDFEASRDDEGVGLGRGLSPLEVEAACRAL
mmetsp:Transcript_68217/g.200317  ORF Transcript_68217/g.200317 Transcript_68217/m.200317 type:complete len:248 (+) Transcript_68217:176-919(+)